MPPHPGQKFASSGNKDNFLTHSLHSAFGRVLSLLPHPGHGSGRIFCRCRRISIYQCPGRPRGQSCGQIIGLRLGRVQSYTPSAHLDLPATLPRDPRPGLNITFFLGASSRAILWANHRLALRSSTVVHSPGSPRFTRNLTARSRPGLNYVFYSLLSYPLAPKGSPSVRQPANVCIQTLLSLQKVRRRCASQPKAVRGGQPRG